MLSGELLPVYIAGKGEACSHIAALLFYLEDLRLKDINTLPGDDKTVTERPQQWHKPPKRNVAPKRAFAIAFHKDAYGKVRKDACQKGVEKATVPDNTALETLVSQLYKHVIQSVDLPNFGCHLNSLQTVINIWQMMYMRN